MAKSKLVKANEKIVEEVVQVLCRIPFITGLK